MSGSDVTDWTRTTRESFTKGLRVEGKRGGKEAVRAGMTDFSADAYKPPWYKKIRR